MGHITIDTAARHYGRRRVGTPRTTTPKPDPLAVMRVRSHEISKVNPWMDTQLGNDFGDNTPAEWYCSRRKPRTARPPTARRAEGGRVGKEEGSEGKSRESRD